MNATAKCIFESRVIERFDDLCVVAESLKSENTPQYREKRSKSEYTSSSGSSGSKSQLTCVRCHKLRLVTVSLSVLVKVYPLCIYHCFHQNLVTEDINKDIFVNSYFNIFLYMVSFLLVIL